MKPFLLGTKVGMTQVFDNKGAVLPVTVVEAGPCVVTQVKTAKKDGYEAVQLGFGSKQTLPRPQSGHYTLSKVLPRFVAEIKLDQTTPVKVGEKLTVALFDGIEEVEVRGVSKGKGFAGVIKRHHFSRGPQTHGSDHHRRPGSIGSMFPQRTLKGRRLPGHMGAERVTIKGLQLVSVDAKNNLLIIKGALPGANGSLIEIRGLAK